MNKRKIIILISIIVAIIMVIIITLICVKKSSNGLPEIKASKEETTEVNNESQLNIENQKYFEAKECISKYCSYISGIYTKNTRHGLNYNKMLYSLLDPNYLKENDITEDNLTEKVNIGSYDFIINKLNYKEENGNSIIVYGKLVDFNKKEIQDYGFIVEMADDNKHFYIIPYDYMQKHEKDQYSINNNIEDKSYNNIENKEISEADIASELFLLYKKNMLYNSEYSYKYLDKEYAEKRFGNVNTYLNYINENREYIQNCHIDKYQAVSKDDYIQYICIDNKNKYYIFNEKSILDYTAMLDAYTIDTPEFIEKYNNAKNEDKVAMNVEKVKSALNIQDYNYVYSKLNETFKQNNFPSLEKFEEYIKNKLYKYNEFYYEKVTKQNDIYELSFNSRNLETKTEDHRAGTIIMKLKDGTDFEMSFNLE